MKALITAFCQAVAAIFGHSTHRSQEKNTAEMKEAKERQQEVNAFSEAEKVVAKKDIETFRKNIAE